VRGIFRSYPPPESPTDQVQALERFACLVSRSNLVTSRPNAAREQVPHRAYASSPPSGDCNPVTAFRHYSLARSVVWMRQYVPRAASSRPWPSRRPFSADGHNGLLRSCRWRLRTAPGNIGEPLRVFRPSRRNAANGRRRAWKDVEALRKPFRSRKPERIGKQKVNRKAGRRFLRSVSALLSGFQQRQLEASRSD
jgi:hypothetical protein